MIHTSHLRFGHQIYEQISVSNLGRGNDSAPSTKIGFWSKCWGLNDKNIPCSCCQQRMSKQSSSFVNSRATFKYWSTSCSITASSLSSTTFLQSFNSCPLAPPLLLLLLLVVTILLYCNCTTWRSRADISIHVSTTINSWDILSTKAASIKISSLLIHVN